ncbi:Uncharacterised protein [Nocardia otitidiscaviarum]|uniref:Uncharacterized protein n=1 Tax=Nocardia otitidiscaviarum TaxID=1823 RepID=A0A378Y7V8_9NOCA|nr:hypothetical protein [Nocardia otitidiscaviarum]SUA72823.1 Uncharacterised protein [Nocardia otitidiscaviarum]
MSSWWQTGLSLGVSVAAPVVGNMIVPGAGGLVGGAVGGMVGSFIEAGEIDFTSGNAWVSAGLGLLGSGAGGGLSRVLRNGFEDAGVGRRFLQNRAGRAAANGMDARLDRLGNRAHQRVMNQPLSDFGGRMQNLRARNPLGNTPSRQQLRSDAADQARRDIRTRARQRLEGTAANSASTRADRYRDLFRSGERSGRWGTATRAGIGNNLLRGLGAAAMWAVAPGRWDSDDPAGGGGSPETDRTAAQGIWVGGHVESMGEGQFKPGPGSGPPGERVGFLFQPNGIAADLQSWYGSRGGLDGNGSLADGLSDNWQLFGDAGNFETDKATVPPLPTVPMQIGAQTPAVYQEAASRLVQTAQQFDAIQEEVAEQVVESAENTELGREQISALIHRINLKAQTSDGTDASFVELLGQAFAENLSTMEERSGTSSEIAKVIADMEARMNAQLEEDRKALAEAMKKWQELPQGPGNPYNPGTPPGQPSPNDPSSPLPTLPTPNIPTPSDPSKPSDPGRLPGTPGGPSTPGGRDPITRDPSRPNDPTSPSVPAPVTPPSGGMGSGLAGMGAGLLSPLLSMLAAQQGGLFGQRGPLGSENDPRRFDRERLSPVQPPQVQPPQAQPTTPPGQQSPQGTGTPGGQPTPHTGPTPGATAPQDSGTPPRTTRSDGKVLYDFKDGRTQYVYPKVYDALEAAFADTKGTDARAAYGMETGKSGEPKDKYPGSRVDPNQLMTGDIAMWEDGRTALLVVFGDENGGPSGGGTLEVIVDGVLTEFGPEMSDAEGDFGAFAGFFHPPGIEESASGTTSGDAIPATDPTVQPVPAMPVSAVG